MAAPSLLRPATDIYRAGTTAVANTLGLVAPASYLDSGMQLPASSLNSIYGCRIPLSAPVDVSARKFITFQIYTANSAGNAFDSLRIVFIDGSGNYSMFLLYARAQTATRPNWNDFATDGAGGYFVHFSNYNSNAAIDFTIALDATPIATSGTLNWSDLAAFEIYCDRSSAGYNNLQLTVRYMSAIDDPILIGGEVGNEADPVDIRLLSLGWGVNTAPYQQWRQAYQPTPLWNDGYEGSIRSMTYGCVIGDGSTATRYVSNGNIIVFRPSYTNTLRDQYPSIQLSSSTRRIWGYNVDSDYYAREEGFVISGSYCDGGDWDFVSIGSPLADLELSNGTLFNAGTCTIDIGVFNSVTFKKCGQVLYDGVAELNNCAIINNTWSGSKGLVINGDPGDYTNAHINFADNTGGYDIHITPTSGGTFDLSNCTVKTGQSLKIHNDSSTAITVKLPAGTSTTLTGGSITIETPRLYQSVTVTNLPVGARVFIYDETNSAPLLNTVAAATSVTWTDTVGASADREIRLKLGYYSESPVSYSVTKFGMSDIIGTCGTTESTNTVTYRANMLDDDELNLYAQTKSFTGAAQDSSNGGPITGDFANIQMDLTPELVSGVAKFDARRGSLWFSYITSTETGIAVYNPAALERTPDLRNITVNGPLQIEYIGSGICQITDAIWQRADGEEVIADTSGTVHWLPNDRTYNGPVIYIDGSPVVTGDIFDISELVRTELSAELTRIMSIPTNPVLNNDARLTNLDATVSSRLAGTASDVATAVWNHTQ